MLARIKLANTMFVQYPQQQSQPDTPTTSSSGRGVPVSSWQRQPHALPATWAPRLQAAPPARECCAQSSRWRPRYQSAAAAGPHSPAKALRSASVARLQLRPGPTCSCWHLACSMRRAAKYSWLLKHLTCSKRLLQRSLKRLLVHGYKLHTTCRRARQAVSTGCSALCLHCYASVRRVTVGRMLWVHTLVDLSASQPEPAGGTPEPAGCLRSDPLPGVKCLTSSKHLAQRADVKLAVQVQVDNVLCAQACVSALKLLPTAMHRAQADLLRVQTPSAPARCLARSAPAQSSGTEEPQLHFHARLDAACTHACPQEGVRLG